MIVRRMSPTEFDLHLAHGEDLTDREAGSMTVPHPALRRWLKVNTSERGVIKGTQRCYVSIKVQADRVDDAERFFTLLRVMGLQALTTI